MHLANPFIQNALQCIQDIHFSTVCVYRTPDLYIALPIEKHIFHSEISHFTEVNWVKCHLKLALNIFPQKPSKQFIDAIPSRPLMESVKRLRKIIPARSRLDTLLSAEVQIINHGWLALYYCIFFHPRSRITV